MAITWQTLVGPRTQAYSIANIIGDTNIATTPELADQIQTEAFDMIWRRLRHWRMMPAPVTGALTIASDKAAIPTDMLEPAFYVITGTYSQELVQKPYQDVIGAWNFDGSGNRVQQQPMIYYFDQASFRFDSPADQAYPTALLYYQQPAPLSATNQTNFVCQYCERLLKTALMLAAAEWTKLLQAAQPIDRQYWDQAFEREAQRVQAESDRSHRAIEAGAQFSRGINAGLPVYSW
jgi:hypothetical protein